MRNPGIKPWQWVLWTATECFCIWGAIGAYGSMNRGGYHAGHWALIVSVPLAIIPLLWFVFRDWQRPYDASAPKWKPALNSTSAPSCELCGKGRCSWNTRLSTWADTCQGCRNPDYFDNDNMIGLVGMSRDFSVGDEVVATVNLGHGVKTGTRGVITHVSTFHGLITVRFENGAIIQGVKLAQVAHG